jgi:spore coat polysaccharide biosynthesis protein SpsF
MGPSARVVVFVQARMSSRRFPGKVLAPFRGRPIVDHVIESAREALPDATVIVVTSDEPSDDPMAAYLASRGRSFFRGSRDDVLGRFQRALAQHPAEWVLRLCADSPIMNVPMIQRVVARASEADLVTTTARRTFPKGQNAELLRASTLRALEGADITADDREHVTRYIHRHPDRFRIASVETGGKDMSSLDLSVDTVEALHLLEALDDATIARYRSEAW